MLLSTGKFFCITFCSHPALAESILGDRSRVIDQGLIDRHNLAIHGCVKVGNRFDGLDDPEGLALGNFRPHSWQFKVDHVAQLRDGKGADADQEATLQAQYVAESGVARAQARLGQARSLITQGTLNQATTSVTTLSTLFANFCGVSVSGVADLTSTVGSTAVPALLCTATSNSTTTGAAVGGILGPVDTGESKRRSAPQ